MAHATTLPVTEPARDVAGPDQGSWTYEAYAALPEDGRRYEVVQGVLYVTPSPAERHQSSSGWFFVHLHQHVQAQGRGRVYAAPFDVELAPGHVVQPDIVVVLRENESIVRENRIVGVPDLLVEITSPTTANYDRRQKLDAYAAAGVAEYWIADPAPRAVELLALDASSRTYRSAGVFLGEARLPSNVLDGFDVTVADLFG